MKAAIFASLVASAAAFAPASKSGAGTALNAAIDSMPGSIDFRGKEFKFDPLKLSETYEPLLPFLREAELKHGRTAMLAVPGFIIPEFVRVPGDIYSFDAVPKVADAKDAMMGGPLGQLIMWIGLWDIIVTGPATYAAMKGEREPGDYGWDLIKPSNEDTYKKYQNQELLHGRLAMMAVAGILAQSSLTGKGFPYV